MTYLDHAGATLYTEQQLLRTMKDLSENVYGNPHSHSECSQRTSELVEVVRSRYSVTVHHLSSLYPVCFQLCYYQGIVHVITHTAPALSCLLCHVYYLCMPRCLETSETLKLLTALQFKTVIVKRQTINVKDTVAKCKVKFHRNCAALCMNCGLLVMLLLC